jgi:V/A-type H+-transporting ATPase subunit E
VGSSIEEFVQKVRQDGVEAGKTESQRLVDEAKAHAKKVVEEARAEGERQRQALVAEGQREKEKAQVELTLACRDLVLRVRENLTRAFETVARGKVEAHARDAAFVKTALLALVREHAATPGATLTVTTTRETREALAQWAVAELQGVVKEKGWAGLLVRDGLRSPGMELSASGQSAVVEVTAEAMVEALKELVSPELSALLDRALGKTG